MSTHSLCFEQKYEKYLSFFLFENFQFLEVKFSIYLNRIAFRIEYTDCYMFFVVFYKYG